MKTISGLITKDLLQLKSYRKTLIIFILIFVFTGIAQETTKKEILISKYIFIISSTIIGAIVGIIASFLIVFIIDKQLPSLYDYINVALAGILGVGPIEAIQIPCVYKWGAEKCRIQMFIVAAIIILLIGGIFLVGENANINLPISDILNTIINFLPVILILATLIIYYISYRVSYRIYKNKEE